MRTLTRQQRAVLAALGDAGDYSAARLAAKLDTAPQSAARTAGSLVRQRLVVCRGPRPATYRITQAGLDHLRAEQLELLT